jgi:SHS2 domain-containing protein
MFEIFDHTADLGIRVCADELSGLFEEAGRALFSVLLTNPDAVRPQERIELEIETSDQADLLHDWLAELLYRFEAERFVAVRFDVELAEAGLRAVVHGEQLDPARHEPDTEVKAVTYHGLKIEPDGPGWLAEVILDI